MHRLSGILGAHPGPGMVGDVHPENEVTLRRVTLQVRDQQGVIVKVDVIRVIFVGKYPVP